jgi:hypothetical protein
MKALAIVCISLSGLLIVLARGYHLAVHPEWTEMQSLYHLWGYYCGAIVMVVLARLAVGKDG